MKSPPPRGMDPASHEERPDSAFRRRVSASPPLVLSSSRRLSERSTPCAHRPARAALSSPRPESRRHHAKLGDREQGCGSRVQLLVNGSPVASDVTVISEECDVEEYLKVGRAAICVVGERSTLLQLVHKVRRARRAAEAGWPAGLRRRRGWS